MLLSTQVGDIESSWCSLRISSYLYSAKSSQTPEPCLLTDQNFANTFWKGSPKEQSCEIISKYDQQFQRRWFFKNFFMSVECKKLPFTRAMLMDRSKFCEQILKRVTQLTFLCDYFKIGPAEEIYTELLKKFNFVTMATRVFDGIKFCEQFLWIYLKRISQRKFLPSLVQIGPAVWEKML